MFLETILDDALHREDLARTPPTGVAGRWRNRLGSTMELTIDDNHRIDGTFHTAVGFVSPSASFHVVGFVEGDALCFCVDFGRRGSVASWSGHHVTDEHGERLVTLWHLAQPVQTPHGEADLVRAMMAGGDEFTRYSAS